MSQPPQGEDPQDQRAPAPGWGPPSSPPYQGGWGQQPGPPYQGGWSQPHGQPGGYGPAGYGQYGQPGQYGGQPGYGQPPYGQYGQPPYGQPPYEQYGGWEQPPAPPRRKRRFGLVFVLLVIAALIGVALTLPARLGGTRLDPDAVQRDVAAQFQQREGVALDLSCDQTMTVADGRTYDCAGTTAEGDPVTITITITSDDGDYTWADS
jgi:hypothetical protein